MTNTAPTTGIATSAPGYTVAEVSVTPATTMAASPSHETRAAKAWGTQRRLVTGNGNKGSDGEFPRSRQGGKEQRLAALAEVKTIEYA